MGKSERECRRQVSSTARTGLKRLQVHNVCVLQIIKITGWRTKCSQDVNGKICESDDALTAV